MFSLSLGPILNLVQCVLILTFIVFVETLFLNRTAFKGPGGREHLGAII